MRKASIGEISSGTLRNEDLLDAFAYELRAISDAPAHIALCDEADAMLEDEDEEESVDDGGASTLVDDLMMALNECAPPYCHFGALESDGACFGFWPSMEG